MLLSRWSSQALLRWLERASSTLPPPLPPGPPRGRASCRDHLYYVTVVADLQCDRCIASNLFAMATQAGTLATPRLSLQVVPFMNEDMGMYLDDELIHHYHLDSACKVLCVLEDGRGRKLIFVELNFLYFVLLYVSFDSFV
ncbi:uncharacterized protein LOC119332068 [Triticum dicoccoides]|uniref:uncharacterized protein LOC119332068 n=1 Tax=Triticum dicoccoides TaxID=85692 RepID=UPI00188DC78B|nr:uncharacterized protein LOC119332068 [Triticum dicoccoides]